MILVWVWQPRPLVGSQMKRAEIVEQFGGLCSGPYLGGLGKAPLKFQNVALCPI